MSSSPPVIVALLCGSIRKLPDFLAIMNRLLQLRGQGILDEIFFSTWHEELAADPARTQWLDRSGIITECVPFGDWSRFQNLKALPNYVSSALIQDTQLAAGLARIRRHTSGIRESDILVWKLRTDLMIPRLELFTATLTKLRAGTQERFAGFYIHHASSLDFFDIADITYISPLSHSDRLGGLSAAHLPHYVGKHIPTEAIIWGNYYNFTHEAFFLYDFLSYEVRKAVRGHVLDSIQGGSLTPEVAELVALHLFILTRSYRIQRMSDWDGPYEVEALFVGGAVPGLRSYRELNQCITDGTALTRLNAGRVNAYTPFGRRVLEHMQAWREAGSAVDTRGIARDLAPRLLAALGEILAAREPHLAGRLPSPAISTMALPRPPGRPNTSAQMMDMLGQMALPAGFELTDDERTEIAALQPRDAPALAVAALRTLGSSFHRAAMEQQATRPRERLHYWANLFASMELLDTVLQVMGKIDLSFTPAITRERASQLKWLNDAALSFDNTSRG